MIGSVSDINFTSFIQKNAALFGDADSIILIEGHPGRAKEYGGGATAPALGYFSIGNQVVFCGTVRVFTYAAPTGRHLSWAHGYDSGTTQGTIPFRSWAEASPAEQSEIREKVSSTMQNSLREALWRTGF